MLCSVAESPSRSRRAVAEFLFPRSPFVFRVGVVCCLATATRERKRIRHARDGQDVRRTRKGRLDASIRKRHPVLCDGHLVRRRWGPRLSSWRTNQCQALIARSNNRACPIHLVHRQCRSIFHKPMRILMLRDRCRRAFRDRSSAFLRVACSQGRQAGSAIGVPRSTRRARRYQTKKRAMPSLSSGSRCQ